MDLTRELHLSGRPLCVLHPPDGMDVAAPTTEDLDRAAVVVAFACDRHVFENEGPAVSQAVEEGRPAWLAVPDGSERQTDLTAQVVRETLARKGLDIAEEVGLDDASPTASANAGSRRKRGTVCPLASLPAR